MPTSFKLVFEAGREHIRTRVFAGPEGGTRTLAGVLVLRHDEWAAFTAALLVGKGFVSDPPAVQIVQDLAPTPIALAEVERD